MIVGRAQRCRSEHLRAIVSISIIDGLRKITAWGSNVSAYEGSEKRMKYMTRLTFVSIAEERMHGDHHITCLVRPEK